MQVLRKAHLCQLLSNEGGVAQHLKNKQKMSVDETQVSKMMACLCQLLCDEGGVAHQQAQHLQRKSKLR